MKKIITALIIVSLICTTTLTVTNATPENDTNKVQLVEVSDKLKNLNAEISKTNNEINNLETTISNNENSIEEHEKQIENAESKISSLKDQISENEDVLSKRLREMYKNNGFTAVNYISFLFESTSLADLIDRVTACNVIINEDNKLIKTLNDKVSKQNEEKDLISQKKSELESLNNETKTKLSEVNTKKAEQKKQQEALEAEQSRLTDVITKNEMSLIQPYIDIINNSTNISEVSSALENLQAISPQLNMAEPKNAASSNITNGQNKIANLQKANANNNNNSNNNTSNSYSKPPQSTSKSYQMVATAYSGGTLTATGLKPVRNPSGLSTIAVDPSVIPLGSKVFVEGYGYALASDTGGDIKGNRIDLYMNSESECLAFGRQTVTLYIVS